MKLDKLSLKERQLLLSNLLKNDAQISLIAKKHGVSIEETKMWAERFLTGSPLEPIDPSKLIPTLDMLNTVLKHRDALINLIDIDNSEMACLLLIRIMNLLLHLLKNICELTPTEQNLYDDRKNAILNDLGLFSSVSFNSISLNPGLSQKQIVEMAFRTLEHVEEMKKKISSIQSQTYSWKNYYLPKLIKFRKTLIPYRIHLALAGICLLIIGGVFYIHGKNFHSKHGLFGEYYADQNFGQLLMRRKDLKINFNWGEASGPSINTINNFSIRWAGFIDIPEAGNYEFTIDADDSARLWIDDELVINEPVWNKPKTASLTLSAGIHSIKLEYIEDISFAHIRFYWRTPNGKKEIVPTKNLLSFSPNI